MEECVSKSINIESEYSTCSYLFRCLLSPSGDPIAGLVHTMALISSSSKLEDICRLFREVSKSLKDVNTTKAAYLLKPLQDKRIFPILDGSSNSEYNVLADLRNESWHIADQLKIRESFIGKVSLLALPPEDIPELGDLFRALRLGDRILSTRVSSQTTAKGSVRTHWAYTRSLRSKCPFIKS
jgi:hypothetical protein